MNETIARIIVVDDEPDLRDTIAEYLRRHGYTVDTASGGQELDTRLEEGPADLLILDVTMPEEDGFSIARRMRARGGMRIVMLTAANDSIDRVVGLELGADDYIGKPFDLREVRARIQGLLRRAAPAGTVPPPPPRAGVSFGGAVLDLETRRLSRPDGTEVPLTTAEFDLLAVFAANPNRILTRERLANLTNATEANAFDRAIDVRIARVRRKIAGAADEPDTVRTVRGVGYMFVPPPR